MWHDDYDFPSVEDRDEDWELPELDAEWREWWEDSTLDFKPPYTGEYTEEAA